MNEAREIDYSFRKYIGNGIAIATGFDLTDPSYGYSYKDRTFRPFLDGP